MNNSNSDQYDAVILGAGIAGMAAALRLSQAGKKVVLIEKTDSVGGLAKTVHTDKGSFDIGIHGFFVSKPGNEKYKEEMVSYVETDVVTVHKKTSIYFRNKFVKYPLGLKEIFFSLDLLTAFLCMLSFLKARIRLRVLSLFGEEAPDESFKDWVTNRFGARLFGIYFGPFSEKTWGLDSSRLSSSALGRRVTVLSIWDVLKKGLMKAVGITYLIDKKYPQQPINFLYAKEGVGKLSFALEREIERLGGTFIKGAVPTKVNFDNGSISLSFDKDGQNTTFGCKDLISSIPIYRFLDILPEFEESTLLKSKLVYRALVVVNIELNIQQVFEDQWVYFPDRDIIFTRINEFRNVHSSFVKEGRGSLSIEIPCFYKDELYEKGEEEIYDLAMKDLVKLKIIEPSNVVEYQVTKVETSYPIYTTDSKKYMLNFKEKLESLGNVHSIGRQGDFTYINMDEAFEQGVLCTEKILGR